MPTDFLTKRYSLEAFPTELDAPDWCSRRGGADSTHPRHFCVCAGHRAAQPDEFRPRQEQPGAAGGDAETDPFTFSNSGQTRPAGFRRGRRSALAWFARYLKMGRGRFIDSSLHTSLPNFGAVGIPFRLSIETSMAGSPETLKARTVFQRLARNGSAVLPELQQPRRACGTCRKDKTQLHLGATCSVCDGRNKGTRCLRKGTEYPWTAATNFSLFSCDVGSAPALAAKRPAPAAATSATPAPSPKRLRQNPRILGGS